MPFLLKKNGRLTPRSRPALEPDESVLISRLSSFRCTSWISASHPPSKAIACEPPLKCSAAIGGTVSVMVSRLFVDDAGRVARDR